MTVEPLLEQPMRDVIEAAFLRVWAEEMIEDPPALVDDTVLLETGLESISFAIFVTELEDVLGYDPFALIDEPYYPVTFGDFVAFYEKFSANREG